MESLEKRQGRAGEIQEDLTFLPSVSGPNAENFPKVILPPRIFPFCIVWTPLPVITWILPFVGHMGICTSKGLILDFAGPYYVNRGALSFGSPTRYIQLDPHKSEALASSFGNPSHDSGNTAGVLSEWDAALESAVSVYKCEMYNFCANNCHSFVGHFLNSIQYRGSVDWGMARLAVLMFFKGRYVGLLGVVRTWLPFLILVAAVILIALFANS